MANKKACTLAEIEMNTFKVADIGTECETGKEIS